MSAWLRFHWNLTQLCVAQLPGSDATRQPTADESRSPHCDFPFRHETELTNETAHAHTLDLKTTHPPPRTLNELINASPLFGPSIKVGMNSEGTKHKVNEAPFYFSERQTMPRCFGQYVQQQLSANKRLPWQHLHLGENSLHSEYLFFEHTTTTTTRSLFLCN